MVTTHKTPKWRYTTLKIKGNRGKIWNTTKQKQQAETQTKSTNEEEALSFQKTNDKIAIGNPHTSIITLNINGLNSPIKRHRVKIGSKNKSQTYAVFKRHIKAANRKVESK